MNHRQLRRYASGAVAVAALAVLTACGPRSDATATDDSALTAPPTRLSVITDGEVRIDPVGPGAPAGITRTVHHPQGPVPPLAVTSGPDGTRVDGRCGDDCEADLVIRVAPRTPVDVRTTAGSVTTTDIGAANLRSEAGSITAHDVDGDLTAQSQAGAVTGTGVTGRASASSQAGAVTIDLVRPGDVTAETQAGSVTVTVPRGDYRVQAADIDQPESTVPDTPGAPHAIQARTAAGQVRITTSG